MMVTWALLLGLIAGVDAGPDTGASAQARAAPEPDEAETAAITASLQVRLDPDPVMFAEPFDVVIEVLRPKGRAIGLPTSIPEKKAVRRVGEPRRELITKPPRPDGRVREIVRVTFVALDLEDVETPSFVVTAPDGTAIDIDELPVRVANADGGVLDEAAKELAHERTHHLYEVADPRPWVPVSGLSIAMLMLGLVRLVERRRRFPLPPVAAQPPPPVVERRPAHELALERLEALLAEGLLTRGEVAPFVQRLMDDVLREYVEARYETPAGKRTTRELCEDLLGLSTPGLDVAGVRRILEAADLVKFAKADLASEVAHQMAGDVRSLIEVTRDKGEGGAA